MPMGVTYVALCLFVGMVCRHISVGFLLFILECRAMRRPLIANKQLEVCAFFMYVWE